MKRIFTALSVVAMLNLAALAGLAVYARTQQWLTKDRVRRAIAVLKGDEKEPSAKPTTMMAEIAPPPARSSVEKRRRSEDLDEITRTELDRRRREIQDGWKLLETQQIALVRDREELEQTRARYVEEQRQLARSSGDNSVQKELEIIAGLKPKQAKELLRQKQDADVVALLKAMDDRKVRKIVGECKSEEERQWIGRILEQMHDRIATQAEVLSAGT